MNKVFCVILFLIFVSACSSGNIQTNDLRDPANPGLQGMYRFDPTVENIIKESTHIVIVELIDVQPYGNVTGRSIYDFTVKSLLDGELHSETIKVLAQSSLYEFEETYLLFLTCRSFPEWPFDVYVPFTLFTFRITNGENIDCLQQIENPETNTARLFIQPFKSIEHNKLSFLKGLIKKHSKAETYKLASESNDLIDLINGSDIIVEINPTDIESSNPFLNIVSYNIISCLKGSDPIGDVLLLPNYLEHGTNYLIFLKESAPGEYELVSRNSIIQKDSQEYDEFLAVWENR